MHEEFATRSPLVLEVVPPPLRLGQKGLAKRLLRVEKILAEVGFDAVNIPEIREEVSKNEEGERQNPFEPRWEPRELGAQIQERFGVPVIINRVVVHHEREALGTWFRETHERFGVRRFVLVGGELPPENYPGPSVPEANALLKEVLPGALVGNITIPGRSDVCRECERIRFKVESGANFFTSQIVYHAEEFTSLLDDLGGERPPVPSTPLLLSVCPLRSAHSIAFLRWLGVTVDERLAKRITADPAVVLERSIEHLVEMWGAIQSHIRERGLETPVGLNIAPVGPLPRSATVDLARRLRELVRDPPSGRGKGAE